MCWIYDKIEILSTPCGNISITDERGHRVKFSVRKNPYSPDCGGLNTDTNYELCVSTADLELGNTYKICVKGAELSYGSSDEHTECVSGTSNGCSIAMGAYDPNDEAKLRQAAEYSKKRGYEGMIVDPPEFDKSCFKKCDVQMLDDFSGFSFQLIDRSNAWIVFPAAWIKNVSDSEECEDAVEIWTT